MKDKLALSSQEKSRSNVIINSIESTSECMTGRGGLLPINKYIENTKILSRLIYKFRHLKHSTKGISIDSFFKQVIAYMIDGSKLNLVAFDELKNDPSYAALLEMTGCDNVIAIGGAGEYKQEKIRNYIERMKGVKDIQIVCCLDDDEAGRMAMEKEICREEVRYYTSDIACWKLGFTSDSFKDWNELLYRIKRRSG